LIGIPVRDRAHILPEVLDAIARQVYNLKWISIYFYTNDNIDDTVMVLARFADRFSHFFESIKIEIEDRGVPRDHRMASWRKGHAGMLAHAYNKCIEAAVQAKVPYLYLMDSDEVPPEDALVRFVADMENPTISIVGGLVYHEKTGYVNVFDSTRRMLKRETIPFNETPIVAYICGSKLIRMAHLGDVRFNADGENMGYDLDFIDKVAKNQPCIRLNSGIQIKHFQA